MTRDVVAPTDRTNVSSRQVLHLFSAFASVLNYNLLDDVTIIHRKIHRNRNEVREKMGADLKAALRIALPNVIVHWDGKLLLHITGKTKVERLHSTHSNYWAYLN